MCNMCFNERKKNTIYACIDCLFASNLLIVIKSKIKILQFNENNWNNKLNPEINAQRNLV
jgi:hypothetical protein